MFYLSKDKKLVIDPSGRVVGKINSYGHFSQEGCNDVYKIGLSATELEQISELLQSNRL